MSEYVCIFDLVLIKCPSVCLSVCLCKNARVCVYVRICRAFDCVDVSSCLSPESDSM